jgi:GR25 family glycosyltransferase involved in LPS biosynthesis
MTERSLKIGISVFFQFSFFSNGLAITAYSLAEALAKLGHIPVLINTNQDKEWYEDCMELKDAFERRNLSQWDDKKYDQLDVFIDIDGYLLANFRRKIAKHVVIFIRKPTFLFESERLVYPLQGPIRNILDCDAVWTWEHFGAQDAHLLELLCCKPVHRIPLTWSPSALEVFGKGRSSWLEQSKKGDVWNCHITETNQSVSTCVNIPLVITAFAKDHTTIPMKRIWVHNANDMKKSKFFDENIFEHTKRSNLEYEFLGRNRITDWRDHEKSFVLSHTRFIAIKYMHLDCIWSGIPIIHNSPWLRDIGHGLERFYYPDNSIKGATKAMEQMVSDYTSESGFFAEGALKKIQSALLEKFNVLNHKAIWNQALSFGSGSDSAGVVKETEKVADKTEIVVGFSDLWDNANHEYNFWTLLLQEACNKLTPPLKVKGIKITNENLHEKIDLLIFAPFGCVWKNVPSNIPKVHITGENTPSITKETDSTVYLSLGFEKTQEEKGIYRFPLWIQYIDWFGADQEKLCNPKSIPIDLATEVSSETLRKKSKFCAFVVSNPSNSVRNEAFHWLSQYKQVDSAGRLYNNVGDVIFTNTAGGGGGELKKVEFLKDYKFCLTYENSRGEGYITEKFLAAKAAGCVPIYWGSPNPTMDFPEGSYIDANNMTTPGDLIAAVKAIDEDPTKWMVAASKPAIQVDKERKRLAEVARLILKPILGTRVNQIPSMIGASSTAESNTLATKPKLEKPLKGSAWNGKTLLTTFATQKYIPSLSAWVGSAIVRSKADSNISIRVYIGDDINDFMANTIRSEYPTIELRRVPTKSVAVEGFPDLWEPQHFAWKLWLYQDLVKDMALTNTLVWYMDVGSIIIRWPEEWLNVASENGICMLEDKEQKNDQWCHATFCEKLAVSDSEKFAQQIVGGIIAFLGGASLPWSLFTEAWKWGQQRDVIVGPKWQGILPDGRPFGHRHDQSILSILRLRYSIPVYPLEKVYNHESIRRTFKSGAALYVHRGQIKEHEDFAKRIGEVHLINLARRTDRIKRFKENHEGGWEKQVCLRPAFDGRGLNLTPALARLFAPNDFMWKKAIMGCALSHLSLWIELANEQPSCENYLILEDDVKFHKDWLTVWSKASEKIPEDYDVLYLGGILPPNREAFQTVLEPVNEYWSRIAPNQIFGQPIPTNYFHFCNYSYILSRKGAQKIIEEIQRRSGYYTSADHMICNRNSDMKHYVLIPQVAGCYQDDDPKYANSEFNNYNRIDGFDSDLWNNDERFSDVEVKSAIGGWKDMNAIPISQALNDARVPKSTSRFYTIGHAINPDALLETGWLRELFGDDISSIQELSVYHEPLDNVPVFFIMKPHFAGYTECLKKYDSMCKEFILVHLSDEYCSDPIEIYNYKSCKKVIRMYPKANIPCPEKVFTIPLGPYRKCKTMNMAPTREYIWSFFGTNWMDRKDKMAALFDIAPNKTEFYKDWMDSQQLKSEEYSRICNESIFIPCPKGQNAETFRFWEALEHGAIPIYVRSEKDDEYFKMISSNLPIIPLADWDQASGFMKHLLSNLNTLAQYRKSIIEKWFAWKKDIKDSIKLIVG